MSKFEDRIHWFNTFYPTQVTFHLLGIFCQELLQKLLHHDEQGPGMDGPLRFQETKGLRRCEIYQPLWILMQVATQHDYWYYHDLSCTSGKTYCCMAWIYQYQNHQPKPRVNHPVQFWRFTCDEIDREFNVSVPPGVPCSHGCTNGGCGQPFVGNSLITDPSCGEPFRVRRFARGGDGTWPDGDLTKQRARYRSREECCNWLKQKPTFQCTSGSHHQMFLWILIVPVSLAWSLPENSQLRVCIFSCETSLFQFWMSCSYCLMQWCNMSCILTHFKGISAFPFSAKNHCFTLKNREANFKIPTPWVIALSGLECITQLS